MTSAKDFREFAKAMVDYVADYQENIETRHVTPTVQPGYLRKLLPSEAPEKADSWQEVLSDVERCIAPGVTNWSHPNFHGYYPVGYSYPSIVADMLSGLLAGSGFTWAAMPASTELETIVMDWLAELLGLPNLFKFSAQGSTGGGVIHAYASDATYYALLLARQRAFKKHGNYDVSKLVVYGTSESHSSVAKAALLAGVKMREVAVDEKFTMRGEALRKQILEDRSNGLIPFYVVCTLGTTTSCAFDNLLECVPVCNEEGLWLHVDAAYAGSAFACAENRGLMAGIERVDSFNFNMAKWMLASIDCSPFWVRDRHEISNSFSVDPLYLRNGNSNGPLPDYRNWQIPLGRKFRALKVWFILRLYGKEGIREHIRHHVKMARVFEQMLLGDGRFEIAYPVRLGLVCFRLKGCNEKSVRLHQMINNEGRIHLTPSRLGDKFILRFTLSHPGITQKQLDVSFENIVKNADVCLMANGFH